MRNALAWVRKSKGDESDVGLQEQRERVHELAAEAAEEYDTLDLGVQTGFSTLTRDPAASTTWLDQHEDVQAAVERIRSGAYDAVVAYDDRRVCRDDYLSVIEHAATQGGCEFVYVADVAEDDLAYDIHRRVERQTKEEEIEKAKAAIERKQDRGDDLGRPRFGMTYNEAGTRQVPGEDFEKVVEVLRLDRDGCTYEEINERTGVAVGTISRILDRREWYVEREQLREA